MAHVNPPYRCDVVGSLLRPKSLVQARVKFACGQMTREELTAVEDAEINFDSGGDRVKSEASFNGGDPRSGA